MAEERVFEVEGWMVTVPAWSTPERPQAWAVNKRGDEVRLDGQEVSAERYCDCSPYLGGGCCRTAVYVPLSVLVRLSQLAGNPVT